MPINRARIKSHKKSGINLKNLVSSDQLLKDQLRFTLSDTRSLLEGKDIESAIPFILWNDTWNKIGIYGSHRDSPIKPEASYRYARGRKVFVDFGVNVGKETSIPHPAIVVYNFAETMIVVPTTSDDGSTFTDEMEDALIRCPADGSIFPNNTIINLHQIRCIAKNRIISDLGCNVDNYILPNTIIDELNKRIGFNYIPYHTNLKICIEMKIAQLYTPEIFHQNIKLKEELENLKATVEELQKSMTEAASGYKN